jgi:hypothetical protein
LYDLSQFDFTSTQQDGEHFNAFDIAGELPSNSMGLFAWYRTLSGTNALLLARSSH